jgi:hypothetical protein
VLFCVICVFLYVVSYLVLLPPGKTPFAVELKYVISRQLRQSRVEGREPSIAPNTKRQRNVFGLQTQ